MTATYEWFVYIGTDAGDEKPDSGDADNWNLMSTDAYDSTGTDYQTNRIEIPDSGTNYSYERWMRGKFSGDFNLIENCKVWKSSGSLSDGSLALNAGTTDTGVTPTDTSSSVASSSIPEAEGSALDVQNGTMDSDPVYTDYWVIQLEVPNTVTTPGDIGSQTITMQYDES